MVSNEFFRSWGNSINGLGGIVPDEGLAAQALPWYKPCMPLLLTLIRHGETEWNALKRLQGHTDVSLSGVGKVQSLELSERLRREEFKPQVLLSSDLKRALETAQLIAPVLGLEIIESPAWRERNLGVFEGRSKVEIERDLPEAYADWRNDLLGYKPSGGESYLEHRERIHQELEKIRSEYPEGEVAVVTHGGSIYAALAIAHEIELPPDRHFRAPNTSLTRFTTRGPKGWLPLSMGCSSPLNGGGLSFEP